MDNEHPVESVISRAIKDTDGDTVSVSDLLDLFEDRSFGPIFLLLGLLVVLPPLGGIPGLPAVVGVLILLFSLQRLLGRSHIWLPSFIGDLSISKSKLQSAEGKAQPALAAADSMITDRLSWVINGPSRYLAFVLVSLLALLMIPLELVPFAVALPGAAIALVGAALFSRDGALMILAYATSAAAFYALWRFL